MSQPIRIFLADDHAVVREGLVALIETEDDMEVVGTGENGEEAVRRVLHFKPDVTLLDLHMPRKGGLEAIVEIKEALPDARILVLTSFGDDEHVFTAIKSGALGYLLKDSGPEALVQAIRQVHHGESSLHPAIARKLLEELSRPAAEAAMPDPLTARGLVVLRLIARGLSNQQIAGQLTISDATVRTHVSNILGKLQLASRTQAALYALREGLATLDDEAD